MLSKFKHIINLIIIIYLIKISYYDIQQSNIFYLIINITFLMNYLFYYYFIYSLEKKQEVIK